MARYGRRTSRYSRRLARRRRTGRLRFRRYRRYRVAYRRLRRFRPRIEVKIADTTAIVLTQTAQNSTDVWGHTPNLSPPSVTYASRRLNSVPQNTSINGRIGNSIFARYINVKGVCRAVTRNTPAEGDFDYGPDEHYYLRTAYVVYIVEDKQVNNVLNSADWTDIFESFANPVTTSLAVANLGRFSIKSETRFVCDSDDPVKDFNIVVPIMRTLRYNGPDLAALCDRNYYIMVGTYTPDLTAAAGVGVAQYNFHSRMTFTDS